MSELLENQKLLFPHRTKQQAYCFGGDDIPTIYYPADDDVFSPVRGRARKEIKSSGATKLYDHIHMTDESVLYPASDGSSVYGEFVVEDKDGGTVRYHYIAIPHRNARFAEDELGCRWHKLAPLLAAMILEGDDHIEDIVRRAPSRDNALAFTDHFYYGHKDLAVDAITGKTSVITEAKMGFSSGLYSVANKIGNLASEFESLKPGESPFELDIEEDTDEKEEFSLDDDPAEEVIAETSEETSEKSMKDMTDAELISLYESEDFGVENEWDDEIKGFIKPKSWLKNVKWDKVLVNLVYDLYTKIKRGQMVNGLIYGKPGTGKSFGLEAAACALKLPYVGVSFSGGIEEDAFGYTLDVTEKGALTRLKTLALKFHQHGGLLALEEINLAKPDVVQGVFSQRLADPFTADVNGEVVARNPLCLVFGTMNVGLAGTKSLSFATGSRLAYMKELKDPSREDFINRLCKEKGDKKLATWIYDRYQDILRFLETDDECNGADLVEAVTFRACVELLETARDSRSSMKELVKDILIGPIRINDAEVADAVYNGCVARIPEYIG